MNYWWWARNVCLQISINKLHFTRLWTKADTMNGGAATSVSGLFGARTPWKSMMNKSNIYLTITCFANKKSHIQDLLLLKTLWSISGFDSQVTIFVLWMSKFVWTMCLESRFVVYLWIGICKNSHLYEIFANPAALFTVWSINLTI